ncbi:MAG: DUF21 domain-containing protein [Planctomycetales bacterium]|nr:DUF21 domain-containing protein [Planctomycetales bacterium]
MAILVATSCTVLCVWGICSMIEAAMYAVRLPYVRELEDSGSPSGAILHRFKQNMERPISAILIVNTAVTAAGISVAGAMASDLFGESRVLWFSIAFTVAALFLAEIFPKIFGVHYSRQLARLSARPLQAVVLVLSPLIVVIQWITRLAQPRDVLFSAPENEVRQMARMSAEEGSIMPYEADLVKNVLALDRVTAQEIMTPLSVVTFLPEEMTLAEAARRLGNWTFSRIPVCSSDEPRTWTGYVLSRDVLSRLVAGEGEQTLGELKNTMFFVSESAPGHRLLQAFLQRRTHLFGVFNEQSQVIGIVTLEDVLESIIGREIVDELDTVVDMQRLAELKRG